MYSGSSLGLSSRESSLLLRMAQPWSALSCILTSNSRTRAVILLLMKLRRTNPEHVSLLVVTTSTSYAALHLLVSFVSGAPHGARAHQGLSPAALKFLP